MRRIFSVSAWLGLFASSWVVSLHAETLNAQQWLDRMAIAIDNLTYEGTLVYVRGHRVEAMRIWHRVDEDGLKERLTSLSGNPREVLRDSETIRTILPEQQSVFVNSRVTEPWYPFVPPTQLSDLRGNYDFKLGKADRVAGLETQTIIVYPRDRFRYGYRLWLEKKSGMLLKSSLTTPKGMPLEQVMFTDIQIGITVSDEDLQPEIQGLGFIEKKFPRAESVDLEAAQSAQIQKSTPWRVKQLPRGFMLASHHHRGPADGQVEHLIYTDGLASVSIYIERENDQSTRLRGAGNLGAINMYGHRMQGYTVTAVGEVPSNTVKLMAESIQQVVASNNSSQQ